MPKKLSVNAVSLALDSAQLVHDNLSGAVAIGDTLWVAGDEACGLDRLLRDHTAEGLHFVADRHYPAGRFSGSAGQRRYRGRPGRPGGGRWLLVAGGFARAQAQSAAART